MRTKRYWAIIVCQKTCSECDERDAGWCNRLDCGCCWEEIVGESDNLSVARMTAGRKAKLPGRRDYGGKPTGTWWVIDTHFDEDVVAHS